MARHWFIPPINSNIGKDKRIPLGYVTLSEAARRLGLSRDQVDWLRITGKISGILHINGYFWAVPEGWIGEYKQQLKPAPEAHITINKAAEMLGVCRTRIVTLRNLGRIEGAICIRKHWYIPLMWVEAEKARRGKNGNNNDGD